MKDVVLSEADVRAMVRLLGENCALDGNINDKRRHLMAGLCRLVKSDAWVWGQAAEMNPNRLPVYIGLIYDGFSEDSFARFLTVQTHPDMTWITAPICRDLQETKKHLTRTLERLVSPSRFAACEVNALWRKSGVFPRIVTFYPLPDGIISAMGLYRQCDREPCTEREAKMVHIVTSEVPWLHVHESPEAVLTTVPRLPVRQRLALELLLQGHSRKTIAEDMDISINTVSGYVRDIYRFFGVTSQSQLVRRFFRGDGGDTI